MKFKSIQKALQLFFVLYGAIVPYRVFSRCYVGFRWYSGVFCWCYGVLCCFTTVPGYSTVLPVFCYDDINNNNNNNITKILIIIIIIIIIIVVIIINIYLFIYLTSKICSRVVIKKEKILIKFDEKEYWCKLLNVSNMSYKP